MALHLCMNNRASFPCIEYDTVPVLSFKISKLHQFSKTRENFVFAYFLLILFFALRDVLSKKSTIPSVSILIWMIQYHSHFLRYVTLQSAFSLIVVFHQLLSIRNGWQKFQQFLSSPKRMKGKVIGFRFNENSSRMTSDHSIEHMSMFSTV